MKKTTLFTLLIMFLLGCSSKNESLFFDDCNCDKIDLSSGFVYKDTLNHYSLVYPDSSWMPKRDILDGNGITGVDTTKGYFRIAAITELVKNDPWPDKAAQQKDILEEFDILEHGEIKYKGQKCMWNVVPFDDGPIPIYSLFITVEHPSENRFYTVNLAVEQGSDMKARLCQLESFLDHFTMY